ncbi:MAG: hypothetical protein AAFU85_09165 [Planctomycetota bacterium]
MRQIALPVGDTVTPYPLPSLAIGFTMWLPRDNVRDDLVAAINLGKRRNGDR